MGNKSVVDLTNVEKPSARPVNRLIRRDILSEVSRYMLENPQTESIHIGKVDSHPVSSPFVLQNPLSEGRFIVHRIVDRRAIE